MADKVGIRIRISEPPKVFVHIPNFQREPIQNIIVSPTPPVDPAVNTIWVDTSEPQ